MEDIINKKNKLQLFAGVGMIAMALTIYSGINAEANGKNQLAYISSPRYTGEVVLEEAKDKKRKGR